MSQNPTPKTCSSGCAGWIPINLNATASAPESDYGKWSNAKRGMRRAERSRRAVQRGQLESVKLVENLRQPAVADGGVFAGAEHGADVNRLAVIAAVVFAEFLHAENFPQSRRNAKQFPPLFPLRPPRRSSDWHHGKICPEEFKPRLVSFLDFRRVQRFHLAEGFIN